MNTSKENQVEWVTRNGRAIPIKDMTDQHIVNAVRYFKRCAEAKRAVTFPLMFQGEMAQYYADQEWDNLQAADVDDIVPEMTGLNPDVWDALLEEAAERKLDIE